LKERLGEKEKALIHPINHKKNGATMEIEGTLGSTITNEESSKDSQLLRQR